MDFPSRMAELLAGGMDDAAAADFLTDIAERGETVEQIVSTVMLLRAQAISIRAPVGAIDVCGTGGDHSGSVNISTAVALVVASCGVPVAKHGNRAASSRSGSTDVLQALGIDTNLSPVEAEAKLARFGITFLSAAQYHPVLARLAPLRRSIGQRTIFNLLGPLLNPAGTRCQLIGVYADDRVELMAEAAAALGYDRAWIVSGGGLDELTVTGPSRLAMVEDGKIQLSTIDPAAFGIQTWPQDALKGDTAEENAAAMIRVLEGAPGAYHDIVCLNAAAALVVADRVDSIDKGLLIAANAIDSGVVLALLRDLQKDSMNEQ